MPDPGAHGGWSVGNGSDEDLDGWLAARGAPPMAARVPVLAFGSNRCPSKLTWLRENLGLDGPVVVLRARVEGLAAVWAAGHRARDGARPATLARLDGVTETHAVWMATPAQVAVLDACEGRGERYDLVRLRHGAVRTEDGGLLDAVWTYWAASPRRAPLLVDGRPVRCDDVDQASARTLDGVAGPVDAVSPHDGPPDPESWPPRVFVYGTLRPGRRAWHRLAPHAVAPTVPASMPGRIYDTGRGYPALTLGGDEPVLGTVVTLADVAAALPALDAYEGPDYRRIRALAGGLPCWVWVWDGPVGDWPRVQGWDR